MRVDVRIIAATRRDLDREVQAGRFRDDLFFRLAVARIELPPLRAGAATSRLLAAHFWRSLGGAPRAAAARRPRAARGLPLARQRPRASERHRPSRLGAMGGAGPRSVEPGAAPDVARAGAT